jgi:perosamine synthetase
MHSDLALDGGPRSLPSPYRDTWRNVTEEDIKGVTKLLEQEVICVPRGGILQEFESRFAAFAGGRYAVATNNGTAALHLALWGVGVRPGTDVLVCDYGFHGMAAAVLCLGARVIPCDCEAQGLTLCPEALAERCTEDTRAILVHHPFGVPADLARIRSACPGIPLVADASHAHGAFLRGAPLACWADATCFSLGLGKPISGGELGCVVTDDAAMRDRMLIFSHVNRVPRDLIENTWKGNAVGLKFRPHPLAMSLALGQLERYPEKLATTRAACVTVEQAYAECGLRPLRPPCDAHRAYMRLVFVVDEQVYGDAGAPAVEAALRAEGVPVEPNHYWPLLQDQPIFQWPDHIGRLAPRPTPVAHAMVPRTVTLAAPVAVPEDVLQGMIAAAAKVRHHRERLVGIIT